jgi:hypothetical protein
MNKKRTVLFALLVFSLAIYVPLMVYAQGCKKEYPKKGSHGCGFEKKIICKLRLAMAHQDLLGLSEDQMAKIQSLKTSAKKDIIKQDAEIDLITVDIKSKLHEDKIDKKGIEKLIDQKFDLKKAKAKMLIGVCAELNNILSGEQKKKLNGMICHKKRCPKKNVAPQM